MTLKEFIDKIENDMGLIYNENEKGWLLPYREIVFGKTLTYVLISPDSHDLISIMPHPRGFGLVYSYENAIVEIKMLIQKVLDP